VCRRQPFIAAGARAKLPPEARSFSVQDLLEAMARGRIRIPGFQRGLKSNPSGDWSSSLPPATAMRSSRTGA